MGNTLIDEKKNTNFDILIDKKKSPLRLTKKKKTHISIKIWDINLFETKFRIKFYFMYCSYWDCDVWNFQCRYIKIYDRSI